MADYLAKYVSESLFDEIQRKDRLYETLLEKIPNKKIRHELMGYHGISIDRLNEIVHAVVAKTVAVDGVGHDFSDGSEAKFVTLGKRIHKKKYIRYAFTIGNLATKTGDLRLTVHIPHKDDVKFFVIPHSVWSGKTNNASYSNGRIDVNLHEYDSLPDWLLECEVKYRTYTA